MTLTTNGWCGKGKRMRLKLGLALGLLWLGWGLVASGQAINTTTVQGTVYLANGQVGAGTLVLSWPAFTTANGQSVAADSTTVPIAADGFVSVNLAPNLGATPAGLFYTAVYYLGDGTTTTQYWVVPAAAQASLAQVQAQLMPAAQAVQSVSKSYVDQVVAELEGSLLTASGGNLTGPLYLNGDPTQPLQAADKHYVDQEFAEAVPLAGGNMTGALQTPAVNGVQSPLAGSTQTTLQAAMNAAGSNGSMQVPPNYAGTDGFTNPNGVYVRDLRTVAAQSQERSVREFGAVCDGVTDDTNALQAALNYAYARSVALTIPQGTCKTRALNWHGESIGGLGKQVSALMGFPGQDVLATGSDSTNLLAYTRLHDLTIYVDQSVDVSCSPMQGRAVAGGCAVSRPMESHSIFAPGGNGLAGTAGTGAGWSVGNCAIAMPALTGAGGNGLRVADVENIEIAATGTDPMAAQYPGAHSTHTCGLYLAQWPQWSEFRHIDIRGLNTGIAIPALPAMLPAMLNADSNRWQDLTIQATHAFTAAAGSNNVLDKVVAMAGNSSATGETPTGLVLDLTGSQQGWTVRNAVVLPSWNAVQPQLAVAASAGAVTGVTLGSEHGLGFDPYGTQVALSFSGSCTAQATASVNANGSLSAVTVSAGGVGCSGTTIASVNAAGTWDTAAPVNLIGGQNMTFFAGNLLKGNGGYTVWNATSSQSNGTELAGGGGYLPGGGTYAPLIANAALGSALQVEQFAGADFGAKLQACLNAMSASYGGTCDGRNFTGSLSMGSNLTISTANAAVLLPCATISTANQVIVTAGTRNVSLRGCALQGGSAASGSQGGTAFLYSGSSALFKVGDSGYTTDTSGFHIDNAVINTTASTSSTAQGLIAYRTQEMNLENLYFLGNANQTGMTLDGTGNYTGGSFYGEHFSGFLVAVNAIGHQVANVATTDWMNASVFVRLHIDCPTASGTPINGTYGINLQQGDGNTFTGGDVEGCSTALHLGPNAQNNTIVGLRNENSKSQVVADAGSSYNNWMTGGTIFTGELTDNGTRNSFLDTFHRSFNGLNGDWYGSQQDATLTNHFRLGIGTGNERGLLNRYQTDYGYRWTIGLSDATAGEQFYQLLDELNSVYRLSIGQFNNGQASTNNQTVINAAGTGAVVLNGSANAGTGGVVFGAGGASGATVATINNAGNAQFNGTLLVGGASQSTGTMTVRNNADSEVDYYLWPGLTTSQKGSYTYKDWNGNSQWYMVKDASNNWALNSALGGLDSFKAYQSTNSGDTYVDASNPSGVVRVNYEAGSGAGFNIYGGNSSSLYASFTGATSIKFPGLAASAGHFCLQVDTSGYFTNTGSACGTGSGSGTVSSGISGQVAYYTGNGTSIGGLSQVPLTAGGTGAATAALALANLGAQPAVPGLTSDGANGVQVTASGAFGGTISATTAVLNQPPVTIAKGGADVGAQINAALANPSICPTDTSGARHCVISLPSAQFANWATAVTITSPYVSIVGQGSAQSVFCSTVNGDALRIYTSPFTTQQAGNFSGFSIYAPGAGSCTGTPGVNAVGIHAGEIVGAHFDDLELNGFLGASGSALWLDNANANTWTERNLFTKVHLSNSTKLLRFSVESGNNSFGYNRMLDVRLNTYPTGTYAVSIENNAFVYNGTYRFTYNNDFGATGIGFHLQDTASWQTSELHIYGENNGSLQYLWDICSACSVTYYGEIQWGFGGLASVNPTGNAPISLSGTESATTTISADGDVVLAAGKALYGTFSLLWNGTGRQQSLICMVGATQYSTAAAVNCGQNIPYNNQTVITNVRVVLDSTSSPQLVATIGNRNGAPGTISVIQATGVPNNVAASVPSFGTLLPNVAEGTTTTTVQAPGMTNASSYSINSNPLVQSVAGNEITAAGQVVIASMSSSSNSTQTLAGHIEVYVKGSSRSSDWGFDISCNQFDSTYSSINVTHAYDYENTAVLSAPVCLLDSNNLPQFALTFGNLNGGVYPTVIWYGNGNQTLTLLSGAAPGATTIAHAFGIQQDSAGHASLNGASLGTYNLNLGTGTLNVGQIFGLSTPITTTQGGLGINAGATTGIPVFTAGATAIAAQVGMSGGSPVKATNTYGCVDGYDHVPCVVTTQSYAGLTNNTSTSYTLATPGANGWYRLSCYTVVTTAATTSSTLPSCDTYFTDSDSGISPSYEQITNGSTANAAGTVSQGRFELHAKASTAMKWATVNYASSGATAMAYAARVVLEYLGP